MTESLDAGRRTEHVIAEVRKVREQFAEAAARMAASLDRSVIGITTATEDMRKLIALLERLLTDHQRFMDVWLNRMERMLEKPQPPEIDV